MMFFLEKPKKLFVVHLSLFISVILLVFMWETPVRAQDNLADRFSAYDPDSSVSINHQPLTDYLAFTVLRVGRSKEKMGKKGKRETYVESNISFGNGSRSRLEGNRLMVHSFSEGIENFFRAYQEGLERVSARRPLSELNRDEQLAFWLNLHNVIVINKIIEEYPITKTDFFREGDDGQPAVWDQKVTEVEGVPLSLADIENIVIENWESPLVVYGFFQGNIGGPSLQAKAFSGEDVWDMLEYSALEFVNSNRGLRIKGDEAEVSLFYEWNAKAFDDSPSNLVRHIQNFGDPDFHGDLTQIREVDYDYYDWYVADLIEGRKHGGRWNQPGGFDTLTYQTISWLLPQVSANFNSLPANAKSLVLNIAENNDIPRQVPYVRMEECAPGEEACQVSEEQEDGEEQQQ